MLTFAVPVVPVQVREVHLLRPNQQTFLKPIGSSGKYQ
jgi:hypothetical protein